MSVVADEFHVQQPTEHAANVQAHGQPTVVKFEGIKVTAKTLRIDQAANSIGGHQGRGAPAKKHRIDLPPRCAGGKMRQFSQKGVTPAAFIDAVAHMGIEIAIGAFCQAERPVDIDCETAFGGGDCETAIGRGDRKAATGRACVIRSRHQPAA